MKKIILLTAIIFCLTSCASVKHENIEYKFSAKTISKTTGDIEICVDPNVEMLMILARFGNIVPFAPKDNSSTQYTDSVDEYFAKYKNCKAVNYLKNFHIAYQDIPEIGIYLKEDVSDFVMSPDNPNFEPVNDSAKNKPQFNSKNFVTALRNFRIDSGFDDFFNSNIDYYNSMIDRNVEILKKEKLDEWVREFYGKHFEDKYVINVTELNGNYGILVSTPEGKKIPHAVVLGNSGKDEFLFYCSHEFSHSFTMPIVKEIYYTNKDIALFFDKAFLKDSKLQTSLGYGEGIWVFNETLNQACADRFNNNHISERYKPVLENFVVVRMNHVYVPQIRAFFDEYEANRDIYKTLEDFVPRLEELLLTLE